MEKHKWRSVFKEELSCEVCGLFMTDLNHRDQCPPWSTIKERDDNETQELKDLKKIKELLFESIDLHYAMPRQSIHSREKAMTLLHEIIEKLEGK